MTQCIEFEGYRNKDGYGRKFYKGKHWLAHRLAYTLAKGDIPKGMCVCHTCDNPACVNLDHLWLGTQDDNMQDKIAKGRHNGPKGETHPRSIFTEQDIHYIRLTDKTAAQLALEFNTHRNTIYAIRKRKIWRHI